MAGSVIYEIADILGIKLRHHWTTKLTEGVISVMGLGDIFTC